MLGLMGDSVTPPSTRRDGSLRPRRSARPSIHQWLREAAIGAAAAGLAVIHPIHARWQRFWWTAALRAQARGVGPGVHCYGPVRFLGTGNVWLGGRGNLYDQVLFETVDAGEIVIGDDFRINRGCLISAHAGIRLGRGCLIGEYVSIRDNNHVFDDPARPIGEQGYDASPIRIGDDVWIGRGTVVLQGVSVGDGAVIGANSVVTRHIPALEVWAGVPARFLRPRAGDPL